MSIHKLIKFNYQSLHPLPPAPVKATSGKRAIAMELCFIGFNFVFWIEFDLLV